GEGDWDGMQGDACRDLLMRTGSDDEPVVRPSFFYAPVGARGHRPSVSVSAPGPGGSAVFGGIIGAASVSSIGMGLRPSVSPELASGSSIGGSSDRRATQSRWGKASHASWTCDCIFLRS